MSQQVNTVRNSDSEKRFFRLSEVTTAIHKVIRERTRNVWIAAEFVRLNYYPIKGYANPEIAEKEGDKVIAQMRATIWRDVFDRSSRMFKAATGEELSDGMKILFLAEVTFHPVYGIGLNILEIDPSYTLGEMARKRKETIERLRAENVFHLNKALPFPDLPRRLAVISVETSKGFSDFIGIVNHNDFGYYFNVMLFPAVMQGDQAVNTIIDQLNEIIIRRKHFDCVVIIRGGGDETGLTCYDDYRLARAVAVFPMPVITGIGHSTNQTVTEMVASVHKITPTDAAFFLLSCYNKLDNKLDDLQGRLLTISKQLFSAHQSDLYKVGADIALKTRQILYSADNKRLLQQAAIKYRSVSCLLDAKRNLTFIPKQLIQLSLRRLKAETRIMHEIQLGIKATPARLLKRNNQSLLQQADKLRLLSPDRLLQRGYSITTWQGKAVIRAADLPEGAIIQTRVSDGVIESEVIKNKIHE